MTLKSITSDSLLPDPPSPLIRRILARETGQSGMPSRAITASKDEETEMPKMKTKSSAKKRFKITATGKVVGGQAGKRHGMIKRSKKFIRDARGTTVLSEPDAKIIKGYMPYAR